MNKLLKLNAGLAQTITVKEARIRVLEGQVTELQNSIAALNVGYKRRDEAEYMRRETLAAIVGRFEQNVAEFTRLFKKVQAE